MFNVNIDNNNQIVEVNENNNVAAKAVTVEPKKDLTVTAEDIEVTPTNPAPNDNITIEVTVANQGRMDSGSFKITLNNGNPQNGGSVLETIDCNSISGDSSKRFSFDIKLSDGQHNIFVAVDTQNQVEEDLENNNIAHKNISVAKRIDIKTSYEYLNFSNTQPVAGETVTIYSTLVNQGERDVSNIEVSFYLGDPAENGSLLGNKVVKEIAAN